KGELSMSTEQLQHFQPLIQSNPELKQQLINYLTVDRFLNIAPDVIIFLIFSTFIVYVFSSNNHKFLYKSLFTLVIAIIILLIVAYLSIPFIAPDIYLQLQTK